MTVIYLPVKFKFDQTKRLSSSPVTLMDRQTDKRRTELDQFQNLATLRAVG